MACSNSKIMVLSLLDYQSSVMVMTDDAILSQSKERMRGRLSEFFLKSKKFLCHKTNILKNIDSYVNKF